MRELKQANQNSWGKFSFIWWTSYSRCQFNCSSSARRKSRRRFSCALAIQNLRVEKAKTRRNSFSKDLCACSPTAPTDAKVWEAKAPKAGARGSSGQELSRERVSLGLRDRSGRVFWKPSGIGPASPEISGAGLSFRLRPEVTSGFLLKGLKFKVALPLVERRGEEEAGGMRWGGTSRLAVVRSSLPRPHLHGCSRCSRKLEARADSWARGRVGPRPGRRSARLGRGERAHLGLVAGRHSPGPPEPGPAAGRRPPRGWALETPTVCRRAPRRGWLVLPPGTTWGEPGWRAGAGPARPRREPLPSRGAGAVVVRAAGRPQPAAGSRSGNSCPGCQSPARPGSSGARRRPPRPSRRRRGPPRRWGAWCAPGPLRARLAPRWSALSRQTRRGHRGPWRAGNDVIYLRWALFP